MEGCDTNFSCSSFVEYLKKYVYSFMQNETDNFGAIAEDRTPPFANDSFHGWNCNRKDD